MPEQDFEDDDEVWDAALFDVSSVSWKVPKAKRPDQFTVTFYDDDGLSFNLIKIRGALLKLAAEIEQELNIMAESEEQ